MKTSETSQKRCTLTCVSFAASALLLLCGGTAHAQQPDSGNSYRVLMEHRMAASERAVTETQRRRFEEGKSDSNFPSDAEKNSARPAVVRASSPEERQALDHTQKGLGYFSKNKFDLAIKEYDEAIRLYPDLAAAHNNRGSALFAMGRYEESAASFTRATQLDHKYGQAYFNLALTLLKLGREKEANASLASAVDAYIAKGDAELYANRLPEAEESYKGLLQIDPEDSIAHFKLGLVDIAAHRYDDAVASFRRIIERHPESADAHEGLSEAYLGLHKYAESAEAADRAVTLRPNSPSAHYLAGLAHASLNQRDKALSSLERLKQLKADDFVKLLSEVIEKKAPGK